MKNQSLFKSKRILIIGIGVLVFGLLFDLFWISIPPQNAPDYLIKERNDLYKILTSIYYFGGIILIFSLIKGIIKLVKKASSKS